MLLEGIFRILFQQTIIRPKTISFFQNIDLISMMPVAVSSSIFLVLLLSKLTNSLSHSKLNPPRRYYKSIAHKFVPLLSKFSSIEHLEKATNMDKIPRGGDTTNAKNDSDDKVLKMSLEAIESIRSCYKAAFISTLVAIVDKLCRSYNDIHKVTWKGILEFNTSLMLFYFGLGLMKVSRIYHSFNDDKKEPNVEAVLRLVTTMSRIWLSLSIIVIPNAITSMAFHLPFHPSKILSASIGLSVFVGLILHQKQTSRATALIKRIDGDGDGIRKYNKNNQAKVLIFDKARARGINAARNMAFFMMSVIMDGIAILFTAYMQNNKKIISMGFGFGLLGAIESFTIAGLIFVLNRSFLPAVIDATSFASFQEGYGDNSVYVRLYEAQKGFYGKIASVIYSATFFGALGSLYEFYKKVYV